ncbi:MAG: hypothetical protein M4D80_14865 [Myxococcota bacterium]|nr:hypothetical protein [Myxococcota bacterium]
MKHLFLAFVLAASATAHAQPPGPPPSSASIEKTWSKIVVQSIKPTLSGRHVYVIKGMHNNGIRGGWTMETSYQLDDSTKVVQITLAAHAPKGSVATRNMEPVEARIEIKELAGPAYSGKPGKFDVVVVDRDGKELARTVYEIKAKS